GHDSKPVGAHQRAPRAASFPRLHPGRVTPRLHEPLDLIAVKVLHGLSRLGRVLLQERDKLAAVTVLERRSHTEREGVELRKGELTLELLKLKRNHRVLLLVAALRAHGLLRGLASAVSHFALTPLVFVRPGSGERATVAGGSLRKVGPPPRRLLVGVEFIPGERVAPRGRQGTSGASTATRSTRVSPLSSGSHEIVSS